MGVNLVIIAAIALLILLIIAVIVTSSGGNLRDGVTSCPVQGGQCLLPQEAAGMQAIGQPGELGCEMPRTCYRAT